MELQVKVNQDAAPSRYTPDEITRTLRLLVDGEMVAQMQDQGEELEVRVRAKSGKLDNIGLPGEFTLPLEVAKSRTQRADRDRIGTEPGQYRHYDFRRTITVRGRPGQDTDRYAEGQPGDHPRGAYTTGYPGC